MDPLTNKVAEINRRAWMISALYAAKLRGHPKPTQDQLNLLILYHDMGYGIELAAKSVFRWAA